MGSIIDYIREYGEYTFLERPFSDEDGLVLAQFSYLKLDGLVPPPESTLPGVTLGEIARLGKKEKIFADTRFAEKNMALFEAMRCSRRFQTMQIKYYVNRIAPQEASQFSAVTCFLKDAPVYIAFRGTDETLTGWQEDFCMACMTPVKSQELSVLYVNQTAARYKGALVTGGHSKGGNLAVYAAANCRMEIRERIQRIYNLDGPGFLPVFQNSAAYREIEGRMVKIVPHSSLVGMILETGQSYQVVESSSMGIWQHDPFTWVLREGHFVTAQDVYARRRAAALVLNRWIQSMPGGEAECFVRELFAIAAASEAETLLDFSGNWKEMLKRMASALHDSDQETKRGLYRAGRALLLALKQEAQEQIKDRQERRKNRTCSGSKDA